MMNGLHTNITHLRRKLKFLTKAVGNKIKVLKTHTDTGYKIFRSLNVTCIKTNNKLIQVTILEPCQFNISVSEGVSKDDVIVLYNLFRELGKTDVFFAVITAHLTTQLIHEFNSICISMDNTKMVCDFVETSMTKGRFFDIHNKNTIKYEFNCGKCDVLHESPLTLTVSREYIELVAAEQGWLQNSQKMVNETFDYFKQHFSEDIWALLLAHAIENVTDMGAMKRERDTLKNEPETK